MKYFFSLLLFLCTISSVHAHEQGVTYSQILIEDTSVFVHYITPVEHMREIGYTEEQFSSLVLPRYTVKNNDAPCDGMIEEKKEQSSLRAMVYRIRYACKGSLDRVTLSYHLFFDKHPQHEHEADLYFSDYRQHHVFSSSSRDYTVLVKDLKHSIEKQDVSWFAWVYTWISSVFTLLRP